MGDNIIKVVAEICLLSVVAPPLSVLSADRFEGWVTKPELVDGSSLSD